MGIQSFGQGGFSIGGAIGSASGFGPRISWPKITLTGTVVAENSAAVTAVGALSVSNAPDGVTYTYALTSDPSGNFEVSGSTLQTASGVDLDYETATSHTVEITATGSDASEIVQSFVISVTDVTSSPIVVTYATPVEASEDALAADEVVTFSASSDDSSDTFAYSLQSDVSGNFEVVGSALRVATGASLVLDDVHSVTVRVTAPSGEYQDETFNVTVIAGGPAIADVFYTDIYTGNSSTQTRTTGIDLVNNDGVLSFKLRDNTGNHKVIDTVRGSNKALETNTTDPEQTYSGYVTSFNVDGYSLGAGSEVNLAGGNLVSQTQVANPKFLDIVRFTGDGVVGRSISHNLGVSPGMITVKALGEPSFPGEWAIFHRALDATNPENYYLFLNKTNIRDANSNYWNNTLADETSFVVGGGIFVNQLGIEYVAYVHAHDPDGIIQCGEYQTDGLGAATVPVGGDIKFLLDRRSEVASNWSMFDAARGFPKEILANSSAAESASSSVGDFAKTATGFSLSNSAANQQHIYLAIYEPGA